MGAMKTVGMIVLYVLLALVAMRILPHERYVKGEGEKLKSWQMAYNGLVFINPYRFIRQYIQNKNANLLKYNIPFTKRPLLYNRRDGIRFTAGTDDRFTNDKLRKYGEPGAIPGLSVKAKETFEGLLPATDPETDPFVPSLEEAATRVHFTEDQAIAKNEVMGILQQPFADTLAPSRSILPTFN